MTFSGLIEALGLGPEKKPVTDHPALTAVVLDEREFGHGFALMLSVTSADRVISTSVAEVPTRDIRVAAAELRRIADWLEGHA